MAEKTSLQDTMARYFARMHELAKRDPQIKAAMPIRAVREASLNPGLSNAEIIAIVLQGYAERAALGVRRYEIAADPETGRDVRRYLPVFDTISYRELQARIEALASAWRHHEHHRLDVDEFVCMFGSTGLDYSVVDMAASYVQAVGVPLQTTMADADLQNVLRDTTPAVLVATIADLEQITRFALGCETVRSVVAIDYDPRLAGEREIFEAAQSEITRTGSRVRLISIDALIAFGRAHSWEPLPAHPQGLDRMAVVIHSSGSTGTPKGVIVTERMANFAWGGAVEQVPTIGVAYAPMSHFMGRTHVHSVLTAGGTAYFSPKTDLTTLFDDIRLVRPTFLTFFPRVFELIYQSYQSEVVRRSGEGRDAAVIDAEVRAEMRVGFLGDRLRGATIGSAPCAPEVIEFVRSCFDIMLAEGYGSSEGGILVTMNGHVMRPPVIDYKLRDVPELGYYRSDKPFPRGELCVKSVFQTPGYFKRPDATAALLDPDGYVQTGDIMEERGPDHLVYIDRCNDVLKLSQAEFVAVGPLGATFEGGSAVIKQIYIYGNSARAYLLAVVVPDMEVATTLIGHHPTEAELKALIREQMQDVARSAGLRSFEVPRDFIIETEPFSQENGLLSSVRKRMRPNFKRKYGERLEALYLQSERKRQDELAALKDPNSSLTVLDKVVKALEASLGVESIDPQTDLNFQQLGGDSLGTVSFSLFLEDIFGVELPVNAIVSPAGNPRRWAQLIEAALSPGGSALPSFAGIHGKGARVLLARDLDIERFLDQRTLDEIPTVPPVAQTRTVLLTGANGFLGHFLCLNWMERVAPLGGKVICLIRARSDSAARQRLDEVFLGVDAELERHYRTLAERHLEVMAADIAEYHFGLAPAVWDRLADEVDHIVHPAALVNHVLSYEHLFGPNVVGTAELIRLALTRRLKRFDFVSSVAAAYCVDTRVRNDEDSPLLERLDLGGGYAGGYSASKWANELQLHSAHRRFGLPVNIFRGDMMMPHRRYKGQINVPDMFTRLLYSIIMTGVAPESFYERGADGKPARAHYDGLPVDFIAGVMSGIGAQTHEHIRTYNILNHHVDDGISLDTIVDWIESAGYEVERVPEHARWLKLFEAKLKALTETQRQQSSLAILQQFQNPLPSDADGIGCDHYIEAVRQLELGPEVPHLTEAFIHKYLDDMRVLGLIAEVRRSPVAGSV